MQTVARRVERAACVPPAAIAGSESTASSAPSVMSVLGMGPPVSPAAGPTGIRDSESCLCDLFSVLLH